MADTKISALTAVVTPAGTDTVAAVQGGVTKKLTVTQLLVAGDSPIECTSMVASGPTVGVGYAAGAGGAVAQLTSKATGVTLDKVCGQITMDNASLAGNTTVVTFVCTNSASAHGDVVVVNHVGGGTMGDYMTSAHCEAGHIDFHLTNVTHATLSDAVVLQYAIIKAVVA